MCRARSLPDKWKLARQRRKQREWWAEGTEWTQGRGGENKGQCYPTKAQNLKWGVMRLRKADGELARYVRELGLHPACSGEPFKM